jgi:hypothetical protein
MKFQAAMLRAEMPPLDRRFGAPYYGRSNACIGLTLLCEFQGFIGRWRTGFSGKKSYGRIVKSCHIVGITGQSSCRGT